jgi:hypothetical protein
MITEIRFQVARALYPEKVEGLPVGFRCGEIEVPGKRQISPIVIPNEVRDLLSHECQEKADSSGKTRPSE